MARGGAGTPPPPLMAYILCDSRGRPRECLPESCMRGWVTKERTSTYARADVCTADGGGASSRGVGGVPGGLGRSRLSLRRARPMPRRSAAAVACPPPVWLPPPRRSAQCATAGVTRSGPAERSPSVAVLDAPGTRGGGGGARPGDGACGHPTLRRPEMPASWRPRGGPWSLTAAPRASFVGRAQWDCDYVSGGKEGYEGGYRRGGHVVLS